MGHGDARMIDDDDEPRQVPQAPEEVNTFALAMMVDYVADSQHQGVHQTFPQHLLD